MYGNSCKIIGCRGLDNVKFEFFFFIHLLINHTSFLTIVSNMSFVPFGDANPAASVKKPVSCKNPNCNNFIKVRSELCVGGYCRPCSRVQNPRFYCYSCHCEFQGTPAGYWTRGEFYRKCCWKYTRMLCRNCKYTTPPPSSDDE